MASEGACLMGSEGADIINNSVVITLMPRQLQLQLQFTPELTESIKIFCSMRIVYL